MNRFLPLLVAVGLAGCAATPPPVADAGASDDISTLSLSCKKPYALTQDCSGFSGAKRRISVDGFDVKVAGSAAGDVVLVMDAKLVANSFSDFFTLNSPSHSRAANDSYTAVRRVLDKAGIEVRRVRVLRSLGNIDGYVLELGGNGYAALLPFTRE
jgi:hypothetical protein